MSEARAITNFIGNGVATVFLSINEKMFDRSKMDRVFGLHLEPEGEFEVLPIASDGANDIIPVAEPITQKE
jgi:hypothetical protein